MHSLIGNRPTSTVGINKLHGDDPSIRVYPNLVKDKFHILITANTSREIDFIVTDIYGKICRKERVTAGITFVM